MNIRLLRFIFILNVCFANAQQNFDFLLNQFQRTVLNNKDSSFIYLNLLEKQKAINSSQILNCKASYMRQWLGDRNGALKLIDSAITLSKDSNDFYVAINNKANTLKDLTNYPEALKLYFNY